MIVSESLGKWRGQIPRPYQKPTLFADRGLAGDFAERIRFDSLQQRLLDACRNGVPRTWLVRGGPATGKSSLCSALAVALTEAGAACALINRRILDVHGAGRADSGELLEALRPATCDEAKWKSDFKHGRIVLFVDGLNEIRLRYAGDAVWKVAARLVFGNHRCPVLATTRSAGEFDISTALRAIEPLELPPLTAEQIDAFLEDRGLDVGTAHAIIEDAGLQEVAANPLVLHRIVDLLVAPTDVAAKLPRNRASVLMRTFEHVANKGDVICRAASHAREDLVPAVAAAAGLCAMFGGDAVSERRELRYRIADLVGLLKKTWPDAAQPGWAHIPTELHLAREIAGSDGELAEFLHQTLLDFVVALLFRRWAPPDFLVLDRLDLAQTLGDWVGLQDDPEAGVKQAIAFAEKHYRPDLLVDVAAANDGTLSTVSREALWESIGAGLAGSRRVRDRTADRLAEISPRLASIGIANGLLGRIKLDAGLVAETQRLLMSGRLNSRAFQRARVGAAWRERRARGTAKDALVSDQLAVDDATRSLTMSATALADTSETPSLPGTADGRNSLQSLLEMLSDKGASPDLRSVAAAALGALGDRKAVQLLCEALRETEEDRKVRGAVAGALGALGDRSAVQSLCDVLVDQRCPTNVRGAAASALGVLGDRTAVPVLCAQINEPRNHPGLRGAAAIALGVLGDRAAVPALCDGLRVPDARVSGPAAKALGSLGDERSIGPLTALLGEDNDQVRLCAVTALGELGDRLSSEEVMLALFDAARTDGAHSVRTSAVMSLSRSGRVDLPLVRYLLDPDFRRPDGRRRDTDWGVQGQTAAAVLRTYERSEPNDQSLQIVVKLLSEPGTSMDVLRSALSPLADLPPPALKRALSDLTALMPSPPDRVVWMLDHYRQDLERHNLAERSLADLASSAAETLRASFPPVPPPWFERSGDRPLPLRTVVILAATPTEAATVHADLELRGVSLYQGRIAGHTVDLGTFSKSEASPWRVVLAQPLEKGPHAMQGLVKDLLTEESPQLMLMVGMCGGIEENGADENSVIVAKQVLNYEPQRLRGHEPSLKPMSYRCDPRILDCLNAMRRRGSVGVASKTGEAAVQLLIKDIGSGEKLIDDLNSPDRAKIVGLSGDLVGVEQEGHGLYHPLWEELLRGTPPPYALIKGVSDLADGRMREGKEARQTQATQRALSVALGIVENFV